MRLAARLVIAMLLTIAMLPASNAQTVQDALPPDDPSRPRFTLFDSLHFVVIDGSVTPRGRSGTEVEIAVTFSVENRGTRPRTLAADSISKFRADSDFPIQTMTGLRLCQDYSNCRRAQATTFAPGSASTARLVAIVSVPRGNDPRLLELREMRHVNLFVQFIYFPDGSDPDYPPPSAAFPRPSGWEQRNSISMNYNDQNARMTNTLPTAR